MATRKKKAAKKKAAKKPMKKKAVKKKAAQKKAVTKKAETKKAKRISTGRSADPLEAAELALRDAALAYPEVVEESPWGHRAMKVKKKTFVFLGRGDNGSLGMSVKLPQSGEEALLLPFASPTRYGLGKSGWVSGNWEPGSRPPVSLLLRWIDESYRAIAPKKLVATLSAPE